MNNEEKEKKYKKKKLYKNLIIVLSLATIILESLALFQMISCSWGFIPFFLSYYFKSLYEEVNLKEIFKRKKKETKTVETNKEVTVKVEDEAKAKLKIIKTEKDTTTPIRGVKYKLTGEGLPENGKNIATNANAYGDSCEYTITYRKV